MDQDDETIDSSLVVLDCRTDSIIVPGLPLGRWSAADILLDPVRERVFAIGADSGTIHVLRDTGYAGIAEARPSEPRPSALWVQVGPGRFDVRYSVTSPCRVDLAIYDLLGREVRHLVAEKQSAGNHSVVWNCQDHGGNPAPPGVYFIRLDTPAVRALQKVVVTR